MTPIAMLDTPTGSYPLDVVLVGPTIEQIPDEPDAQVAATIARMCQYVCEDSKTLPVYYVAQAAIVSDPGNPLTGVHSFVRSHLRFRNDEETARPFNGLLPKDGRDNYFVEALRRPVHMATHCLQSNEPLVGDCDDYASFCAALLKALDIDCCFATVAADDKQPDCYSHVYTVAYVAGQRVAMDCSHGPYAGWEAPNRFGKLREWRISYADWKGLGVSLLLAGFTVWKYRHEIQEFLTS